MENINVVKAMGRIFSACLATVTYLYCSLSPSLGDIKDAPKLIGQISNSIEITAMALTFDGKFIITSGRDKLVKVWEAASGQLVQDVALDYSPIAIASAFDRDVFATLGSNGEVTVWDIQHSKLIFATNHAPSSIGGLAFSRDGKSIVIGGNGITILDAVNGAVIRRLCEPIYCFVSKVLFTTDSKFVVSGGSFKADLSLWSVANGALVKSWSVGARSAAVQVLSISPDGSLLATSAQSATFQIWSVPGGSLVRNIDAGTGWVNAISFSNDGRFIASASQANSEFSVFDGDSYTKMKGIKIGDGGIVALAFSNINNQLAAAADNSTAYIVDVLANTQPSKSGNVGSPVESLLPARQHRWFISGNDEGIVSSWDLLTGELRWSWPQNTIGSNNWPDVVNGSTCVAVSDDDNTVASGGRDGTITLWDANKRDLIARIKAHDRAVQSISFSPDGMTIASVGADRKIGIWEARTGKRIRIISSPHPAGSRRVIFVSSDEIAEFRQGEIDIWSARSGEEVRVVKSTAGVGIMYAAFSSARNIVLYDASGGAEIRDTRTWRVVQKFDWRANGPVALSKEGDLAAVGATDGSIRLYKTDTGRLKEVMTGHEGFVNAIAFALDGLVLSGGDDTTIRYWETGTGQETLRVSGYQGGNWDAVAPDGRYDSNNLLGGGTTHWVMPDDPARSLRREVFMRDYYEPRLLPRLLACHEAEANGTDPEACKKAFRPIGPLASLNRIQPEVKIAKVERGSSADEALVTVEVAGNKDATQKNGKLETAAYDLRLFRNGQIVGQWPEPKGGMGGAEDIAQWKTDSLVPGTENAGKATHVFKVKLADRDKGQPVKFTAYAFNEDRVKSETASNDDMLYKVPDDVGPAKPRAYVIAIGVNAYQKPEWRLGFAVKDALDLSGALNSIAGYEVVSVPLVSGERNGAKLDEATKQDIADVLALLGGHEEPRERLRQALSQDGSVVDRLRQATPDDLVIIGFSGHGWADPQGRFYLLPSNSGTEAPSDEDGPKNAAILSKFISSEELSQWLKDVDAGELAMIIDACHSAASVDQPGFKPGPMGDRGLGQLAYDKGMRILAATQADNVALESEKLGQGLLTYALIDEGLKDHKAAPDGKGPITIGAWLHYAEQRVPQLYDDIQAGKIQAAKVVVANDASRSVTKEPIFDPAFREQIANHAQTPQLFDFRKKDRDAAILSR